MANSNVNITNKLFAYIKHGVDITDNIKDVYNQSLILIGDEKQIYVPAYDAYVGISMTSYNITNNKIDALSNRLDELTNNLSQDLVAKIYPNYSLHDYNTYTASVLTDDNDPFKMSNEITFKGLGNYEVDPTKRTAGGNVVASYTLGQGTTHNRQVYNESNGAGLFDNNQLYANSGITLTAYYGGVQEIVNPQTGQIIRKQIGNYITIDDKQTWSYMTSAYSYTLNYAQDYTNSEINRLYHNLLGTNNKIFVPVSIDSVFINVEDEFDKDTNGDDIIPDDVIAIPKVGGGYNYFRFNDRRTSANDYYIRKINPETIYNPDYDNISTQTEYTLISDSDIKTAITSGVANANYVKYDTDESSRAIGVANVNQLYVIEEESVNTYNMNLRDGINTLKEVAYILDQLTDGQLGAVTYITYAEYNSLNNDVKATYTLIQPINNNPANSDIYAYNVNTIDPENLGIQIAYSITGNKTQIDDLHRHIELEESGKTSLRSINTTETNLASIVMKGGYSTQDKTNSNSYWVNTDTNQVDNNNFHPNRHNSGLHDESFNAYTDYRVGDVDIRLKLDLATTYSTINDVVNTNPNSVITYSPFGTKYRGTYQFADMTQLGPGVTYYTYDTSTGNMVEVTNSEYDYTKLAYGTQYYWVPNTTLRLSYANLNLKVNEISKTELINASEGSVINGLAQYNGEDYKYFFTKDASGNLEIIGRPSVSDPDAWITEAISFINDPQNADKKVYYATEVSPIEYHPLLQEKNQIATTDWVGAFVNDKLNENGLGAETAIDKAKEYVDNKINDLDTNYAYSDFIDNVWNYVQATEHFVEGSSSYLTAYNNLYSKYIAGNQINYSYSTSGSYTFSSDKYADTLRNKVKSEYVYNIVEENGIVTPETRELPEDRIIVENNIWGHEDSDQPYQFDVLPAQLDVNNNPSSLLATLYNWVNSSSNDYPQNQLFVKDGIAYAKVAIPTGNDNITLTNKFEYNSATGQYIPFDSANHQGFTAAIYKNPNHKLWVQLYSETPKYVEIDLSSAKLPSTVQANTSIDSINTLIFNDIYSITKQADGTLTVSGADDANVYYITTGDDAPSQISHKVEYLTSTQKHFDYSNGGNGENELKIKANIVKLEDAKADNTGFADAFDVKTYIDNLFKWVDISASIDENTLLSRDAFFRHISYSEYETKQNNGETVSLYYKKTNNQYEAISGNPVTAYYYYSDNAFDPNIINETDNTSPNLNNRGAINNNYSRKEFNAPQHNGVSFTNYNPATAKYTSDCDYYIKLENAKINPLNLTQTRFGL